MKTEQATKAAVIELWSRMDASKIWGEAERVAQCAARPEIVMIFGRGDELFELVHLADERVIDEKEYPSHYIERFKWDDLQ